MGNPTIRLADDLDELQTAAEAVFLAHFPSGRVPAARKDLQDVLLRAYSIGYDAAHRDHVDGNIG